MSLARHQFSEIEELFSEAMAARRGKKTPEERLESIAHSYEELRKFMSHETLMGFFKWMHWHLTWIVLPVVQPIERIPVLGRVIGGIVFVTGVVVGGPLYWLVAQFRKLVK